MSDVRPEDPSEHDLLGGVVDLLYQLGPPGVPTPARIAAGYRCLVGAMDLHGFHVIRGADVLETWRSGPASHGWVDANAIRPGKGAVQPIADAHGVIRMLHAHVLEVWREGDARGWSVRVDGTLIATTGSQAEGREVAERNARGAQSPAARPT